MTGRLLLCSVLVLSVAGAACDENLLNPMADRQPRAKRYKESAFFGDGLTMRAPPPGTVPRERVTMNPRLTTGREADGPVQSNGEPLPRYVTNVPIPVTRKLLDLGRKRYDITCGTCHGPVGDGESIVAQQMALRPPPSLHLYTDRPAGYFYEVIVKGFGMMASYAADLTLEERWAVVAYIRALQLSQSASAAELPADVRQRLDAMPANAPAAPPPTAPAGAPGHNQPQHGGQH